MQRASDANCNYAVIVGDSEVSGDSVTIKDLVEGNFPIRFFRAQACPRIPVPSTVCKYP